MRSGNRTNVAMGPAMIASARTSRIARHLAGAGVALAVLAARGSGAQVPGLPVLQGAFPAAGFAVAVDAGHGDGQTAAVVAAGYGPQSGRLHVDFGGGVLTGARAGFKGNPATYGGRVAVRVLQMAGERVAVTPFAGFGSTRWRVANTTQAGPPVTAADTGRSLASDVIPVGASVGARLAVGATGAVALSVAPFYAWYRQSGLTSADGTRGRVRIAGVAELSLAERFGVVAGVEVGQTSDRTRPGPSGAVIGGGVSYRFGRR